MIAPVDHKNIGLDDCINAVKERQKYLSNCSNTLSQNIQEIKKASELEQVISRMKMPFTRIGRRKILQDIEIYESLVKHADESSSGIQDKKAEVIGSICGINFLEQDVKQAYQKERDELALQIADLVKKEQQRRAELENANKSALSHLGRLRSNNVAEFIRNAKATKTERIEILSRQKELHESYVNDILKPMEDLKYRMKNLEDRYNLANVMLTETKSAAMRVDAQIHNFYTIKEGVIERYNQFNGNLDAFKKKLSSERDSLFARFYQGSSNLAGKIYHFFSRNGNGKTKVCIPKPIPPKPTREKYYSYNDTGVPAQKKKTFIAMREDEWQAYNVAHVPHKKPRVLDISGLKDVEIDVIDTRLEEKNHYEDDLSRIVDYKNNNPNISMKKLVKELNLDKDENATYDTLKSALDKGYKLNKFDQNLLTLDMTKDILYQYAKNTKKSLKDITNKLTSKYHMNMSESTIRRIARRELGDVYRKDGSALKAYKELSK